MRSLTPNAVGSLVDIAVSTQSLLLGRALHAQILKLLPSPLPPFFANHLIHLYSKLDRPDSARLLLALTPSESRSVVTWTSLIAGAVQNGRFSDAQVYFRDMRRQGFNPNDFTFPCLFKASASLSSPPLGQQLHALAAKLNLIGDVYVGCSAFDMYCKLGLTEDADKMFYQMPSRNIALWNACMSNHILDGRPLKAVHMYVELLRDGEEPPNGITFCAFLNACSDGSFYKLGQQLHGFLIRGGHEGDVKVCNGLIDFYGKCREVKSSWLVFQGMRQLSVVSWCSMVAAYEQNDMGENACSIFLKARKENVIPTDFLVSSVLSACAGLAVLELGGSVHGLAVKACIDRNVFVGSALVDMYGKCGCIEDCEKVFGQMPERNLITWNALIGGYAHQGHGKMALQLFHEMMDGECKVMPNYVTFVSVLTACSRAGSVGIGMEIFESMREKFDVVPGVEHYACIVDMLGRAGQVERAYDFIKRMPLHPTISVWGALLGACRMYGKPELGKIAAEHLFNLDPQDSGNHVILSNMFAAAGR